MYFQKGFLTQIPFIFSISSASVCICTAWELLTPRRSPVLTSWTRFRSVFWWGAQILSRITGESTSESSSRAPGGLSRADSLPGTGKQKPCHKKWMELDSVASTAALVPSGHAWNADCLFPGKPRLRKRQLGECGRNVRVWLIQSAGAPSCHLVLSFAGFKAYRNTKVKFAGSGICVAGKQVTFLDD